MSLDGFVAGPHQSLEQPLGIGGMALHEWAIRTRAWREAHGLDGGETGPEDEVIARAARGVGATVMGRNMFGPIRGAWPDDAWRGWWGDEPPFHTPVFVLTHHAREPLEMAGGTTFHFVTDGIESAIAQARAAAADQDVVVGGGASTARQALAAGLVDELEVHVVPILLGEGERLFAEGDGTLAGYRGTTLPASGAVAHFRFDRA